MTNIAQENDGVQAENPSESQKRRLTLELSPKTAEYLKGVQKRSGAKSMAETVRRSLALFDLYTEAKDRGYEVVFRNETTGKEEVVKLLF